MNKNAWYIFTSAFVIVLSLFLFWYANWDANQPKTGPVGNGTHPPTFKEMLPIFSLLLLGLLNLAAAITTYAANKKAKQPRLNEGNECQREEHLIKEDHSNDYQKEEHQSNEAHSSEQQMEKRHQSNEKHSNENLINEHQEVFVLEKKDLFVVNVEGAIYRDDKWLMVERSAKETHAPGGIAFVGGKVDDEGNAVHILEKTLRREIEEEVGVVVKEQLHYVRSTSFVTDDGIRVVDIVFLCQFESGEPWQKCPDEVEAVFWMTYEEIMAHPETPVWLRENLECAESVRKLVSK